MNYTMRLDREPFNKIQKGLKNIEYRLNDEKRKLLKIGDTITFCLRPLEIEKINVIIEELNYYPTLLDMYTATFEKELKNTYSTPEEAVKDTLYYTQEEVEQYGCVAIHFKIIEN